MCGIPHHAMAGYVGRLIRLGLKVAVSEQVEEPAPAKGLVLRDDPRRHPRNGLGADLLESKGEGLFVGLVWATGAEAAGAFLEVSAELLPRRRWRVLRGGRGARSRCSRASCSASGRPCRGVTPWAAGDVVGRTTSRPTSNPRRGGEERLARRSASPRCAASASRRASRGSGRRRRCSPVPVDPGRRLDHVANSAWRGLRPAGPRRHGGRQPRDRAHPARGQRGDAARGARRDRRRRRARGCCATGCRARCSSCPPSPARHDAVEALTARPSAPPLRERPRQVATSNGSAPAPRRSANPRERGRLRARSSPAAAARRSRRRARPAWRRRGATDALRRSAADLLARALVDDPPAHSTRAGHPRRLNAELDEPRARRGRQAPHPGARGPRARAHRDRLAQGPLQPGLRLLDRGHPGQPAAGAGRLRAPPDAGQRRALRHPRAQGATRSGSSRAEERGRARAASSSRARASVAAQAARLSASAGRRRGSTCSPPWPRRPRADGYVRPESDAGSGITIARRPAPGGRASRSASAFVPNDLELDPAARADRPPHRSEHGRQVDLPAAGRADRAHGAGRLASCRPREAEIGLRRPDLHPRRRLATTWRAASRPSWSR